jgi:hypothetical protein
MKETRNCNWCASNMDSDAKRCPHCGGWRKDIYVNRMRFYAAVMSGMLAVFASIGFHLWFEGSYMEAVADKIAVLLLLVFLASLVGAGVFGAKVSKGMQTSWWL